jgi:predicted CXXCH cytochrome family protein
MGSHTASRATWLLFALVGLAVTAALSFRAVRRSHRGESRDATRASYVDAAVCSGCHQDIVKTYRLTGMGRSFYRPRLGNIVEDYKTNNRLYNQNSDRYYTMLERDGKFYQRRHQIGFADKEVNVWEQAIDFVIGSGNHARTYLYRNTEGRLVELPVSWYAEKGGYWAMSPGYDRPDQQDFRRAIGYDCMSCHNGYPPEQGPSLIGVEPVFGNRIPEGIDCQRCHGPGQAHVEAAGSGRATASEIRSSIVNPARLDRARQLEVCMQCHLETSSRPLPYAIPRYDRWFVPYRPGEPLGDYFVYFDRAPGASQDDRFEIAHAGYRLRLSACFQSSQMTCATCHDPHRIPRGSEAVQDYVTVCRGCHAAAHAGKAPTQPTCLECHMPKRRAEDAVHAVMTDHYIQRRKPARDLLTPLQEPRNSETHAYHGEVVLYYPPQLPATPERELYLAVAQVQDGANLEAGIPRLREAIEKYTPERPESYFELGRAYSKAGNPDEAIHWEEEALRRKADFPAAFKELGAILTAAGRPSRAAEVLEKAAAAPSHDAADIANLGNVYLHLGRVDLALETLQRALRANPYLPDANNSMGLASLQKGDRAGAENYFRNAIRLQPELAEAHNNLANLLAASGDYAQAAYHFEKAIASNPGYVEAHNSFALALIGMHAYDKALAELQETVRLDPNRAQAHSDLADVLAARGRLPNAADEYRLALRLKPNLAEANYGLGNVLAAQSKNAEAAQQFGQAIQTNPAYYEAHLALAKLLARQGDWDAARPHFERAAESGDSEVRQAALTALRQH